jgi:hypothetical protein
LDSASLAYVDNNHSKNNDNKKVLYFTLKSHQSLSACNGHTWHVQAMKDV